MIAEIKKKMVAFRCSNCGTIIKSVNNIFSIPGEKKVLKCDCGNKMDIVTTNDGKLRFSLRCRFCGNMHQFNISRSTIFNTERLILPCDVTSFDILFIGDPGKVYQAIEASENMLDEWAEANDYDDIDQENEPEITGDHMLVSAVVTTLDELALSKKIHCKCKNGEGKYKVDIYSDNIVISCNKCGCSRRIETHEGSMDAYNVLECTELFLKE
ncbi:MAG: hypothetical protein K6F14_01940 [Clostridiales bacterium]|nr:hypothetical protein [Clostridiales bacterium]